MEQSSSNVRTSLPGCPIRTLTDVYQHLGNSATLTFGLECPECREFDNGYEIDADTVDAFLTTEEFYGEIGRRLHQAGYRYAVVGDQEQWVCPECAQIADSVLEPIVIR